MLAPLGMAPWLCSVGIAGSHGGYDLQQWRTVVLLEAVDELRQKHARKRGGMHVVMLFPE